jgi:coproporphyrinogen III oxidase-like Fe-S oxidoreductase
MRENQYGKANIDELVRQTDDWIADSGLGESLAEDRYGIDPTSFFWIDVYPRLKRNGPCDPSRMLRDWSQGDWRRITMLYFHIPFCVKRCSFCYYDISTDRSREPEYLDALSTEAKAFLDQLEPGTSVGDLYFGGGTPSTVAPSRLQRLFELVYEKVDKAYIGMVTLELHPRTMRKDMHQLAASGHIQRVSMGVQSFSRSVVEANGRIWVEPDRIWSIADKFRRAGLEKIGLDFMVGLHRQSAIDVAADIAEIDRLIDGGMIDSVSVYPRSFNVPSVAIAGEVIDAHALLERFRSLVLYRLFFESIGWKESPMYLFSPAGFVPAEPSALTGGEMTAQALAFGNSARSTFGETNYRNIREYGEYLSSTSSQAGATGSYHRMTRREFNRRHLQFAAKRGVIDAGTFPHELNDDEREDFTLINDEFERHGLIERSGDIIELTALGMLLVEFIHRRYEKVWVGDRFSD